MYTVTVLQKLFYRRRWLSTGATFNGWLLWYSVGMKYIYAAQLFSLTSLIYVFEFTGEYVPVVFTNDVAAFFADPLGVLFLVTLMLAPIVYFLEK